MIDPQEIAAWTSANLLARHEYARTVKRRQYVAIDPVQVIALRDFLGLTWGEIADRLGCSTYGARDAWRSATDDRAKAHGVNRTEIDLAEATRLRALGWPWREIAQRLQCHPRAIHKAMRRKGLR